MPSDSSAIVRSLINSDLIQVDLDGPGHPRALMRVEQLAELWLALKSLQAPGILEPRLQDADGAVLFPGMPDIEPEERRVTSATCHDWIRAHAGQWFTYLDVAMGVLNFSREEAEAYTDGTADQGRSRHIRLNTAIRQAIKAFPEDWKYEEFQPTGTSPMVRCIVRPGEAVPPRPGSRPEVAP